jgi:hypothetical protein
MDRCGCSQNVLRLLGRYDTQGVIFLGASKFSARFFLRELMQKVGGSWSPIIFRGILFEQKVGYYYHDCSSTLFSTGLFMFDVPQPVSQ